MKKLLLLAPVILPIFFWAVYHYLKDRHLPEPIGHLIAAFAAGMLAAGASQLMYFALEPVGLRYDAGYLAETSPFGLFAYALLLIGPIEELSKLALFCLVVLRFDEFDEVLDGIIYASFVALGYAAVENWQYLVFLTPLEAIGRGFASPVVHIVFASIWGLLIARAHVENRPLFPAALTGFAIAALLHGVYDFIVLQQPYSALPAAAALIVGLWVWRLFVMRKLRREAARAVPPSSRT
jgi:RsiW-degrading membrane proteinase PrsW (M82 family)